jgi:hypothetical protein
MYMMATPRKRRRWTIASARQRLPKLIAMAAREPQAVYRRDKLVAAVVSPELKQEMDAAAVGGRGPTLAAALDELRGLCAEEGYTLAPPKRIDRKTKRRRR